MEMSETKRCICEYRFARRLSWPVCLRPARGRRSPNSFYEVETKYIFGFTEGSGIGLEGEKEFSAETVAGFGRRDGHYAASQTKLEFEHTPNQFLQIEFGALVATQDIRNVTGFDDRNTVSFGGLFGEIRYLMVERGASSPFAITVSVEPVWRRLDETTGERVTNYELESKLNIDTQLIENRLYLGLNLIYEPETTRIATGEWEKEFDLRRVRRADIPALAEASRRRRARLLPPL